MRPTCSVDHARTALELSPLSPHPDPTRSPQAIGHAKRTHALDDRRKILVHITESGQALVNEVKQDMVENLLEMMAVLEPADQKAWSRIYEKILPLCQKC